MLVTICETVFSLLILFVIYDSFLGDVIADKLAARKNKTTTLSNIEKLARVKSVSDNPKDIEKFITDNTQYLSSEIVEQLVCRIELLKADMVIDGDNLKTRIDSLDQHDEVEEVEKPKTRAKRK